MSNAIQFMAALGSNTPISHGDYGLAVMKLDIDDLLLRQALLDRDCHALNELVGGRERMWCLILSPDDEPTRKEEDEPVEEPAEDAPTELV